VQFEKLPYRIGLSEQERNRIKSRYQTTFKRLSLLEESALVFEDEHSIVERWALGSPEFIEGQKSIAVRRYRDALNKLEHLVVQRLLELTKLNASGLGETSCLMITGLIYIVQDTNSETRSRMPSVAEEKQYGQR
jgi:hypothetical protein